MSQRQTDEIEDLRLEFWNRWSLRSYEKHEKNNIRKNREELLKILAGIGLPDLTGWALLWLHEPANENSGYLTLRAVAAIGTDPQTAICDKRMHVVNKDWLEAIFRNRDRSIHTTITSRESRHLSPAAIENVCLRVAHQDLAWAPFATSFLWPPGNEQNGPLIGVIDWLQANDSPKRPLAKSWFQNRRQAHENQNNQVSTNNFPQLKRFLIPFSAHILSERHHRLAAALSEYDNEVIDSVSFDDFCKKSSLFLVKRLRAASCRVFLSASENQNHPLVAHSINPELNPIGSRRAAVIAEFANSEESQKVVSIINDWRDVERNPFIRAQIAQTGLDKDFTKMIISSPDGKESALLAALDSYKQFLEKFFKTVDTQADRLYSFMICRIDTTKKPNGPSAIAANENDKTALTASYPFMPLLTIELCCYPNAASLAGMFTNTQHQILKAISKRMFLLIPNMIERAAAIYMESTFARRLISPPDDPTTHRFSTDVNIRSARQIVGHVLKTFAPSVITVFYVEPDGLTIRTSTNPREPNEIYDLNGQPVKPDGISADMIKENLIIARAGVDTSKYRIIRASRTSNELFLLVKIKENISDYEHRILESLTRHLNLFIAARFGIQEFRNQYLEIRHAMLGAIEAAMSAATAITGEYDLAKSESKEKRDNRLFIRGSFRGNLDTLNIGTSKLATLFENGRVLFTTDKKTKLTLSKTNIWSLLLTVKRTLSAFTKTKEMEIHVDDVQWDSKTNLPMVDEPLIYVAFYNLLENAVKYSEPKRFDGYGRVVRVNVDLSTSYWTVRITSESESISEHDRFHIFDMWARLSTNKRGTGMGLPVTKRIVELHRGEVYCESKPLLTEGENILLAKNVFVVKVPRNPTLH